MSTAQRQWILAAIGTAGLAGSLVMSFLILSARDWRLDFTPGKRYVLSDHARRVLDGVAGDLQILAFLRADDPRNPDIEDLLVRVNKAAPRVRYRIIDVNRNPAVARTYGVDAYGSVVVEGSGRHLTFTNPTEDALMAAIVHVTHPGQRRIYVLTGHGERNIKETTDRSGYGAARVALMTERYEVNELSLVGDAPVPDDATVLVIPGPRREFLTGELLRLDTFVRRGGALLVMLDPGNAPGLVALLRRYGVSVSDEVVLDADNRLFAGDYLTALVPERAATHPVSAGLQAPALMSQMRAVDLVASDLGLNGVELLKTAPDSWRTADFGVLRTGAGEFVANRDRRGPVPVGASVLVRPDNGSGAPGRVLVLGDADFADNFFLGYLGNRDLLLNAVNWLARAEGQIGSYPSEKTPGVNQFFVSARQGRQAFWLGTVVEPAVVLGVGIVIFLRRRWRG